MKIDSRLLKKSLLRIRHVSRNSRRVRAIIAPDSVAQKYASHLMPLLCQRIDPSPSFAFRCFDRGHHPPVPTSFKLIKACPMHWKVRRFEKIHIH